MAVSLRNNPNRDFERLKKVAGDARRHQDKEVWLNIAYYLGNQYYDYVTLRDGSGKLVTDTDLDKPKDQRLPEPILNRIMHYVNQNLAFAMKARPAADVLPASDDYLSQSDARIANGYVQYLQEPNVGDWDSVMWNANLWAMVANNAYIKWVWSDEYKRPEIIFVPSTDLYVDPYVRNFYKARWVIHSQFLDPEQVYHVYGKDVPTQSVERADLEKTELLREMGQSPVMEGVTVNEYWELPNRRHPKGRFRVWAGNEVLIDSQPYPYEHGGRPQLPFTIMGAIPRPNSQFYASPVTFLRNPQKELNRYLSQRVLTRQAWALLKLWLPEDIELESPWDNSPNQVLRGSSSNGAEPKIIGPPGAMPDNQDGEWLRDGMMDVVGIHEVSQGQVPGRVEAAKAIELLRESDTSRLAVLLATQGTTISKGWYQALMLAHQFSSDEIVIETYSPEGVPEVKRFFATQFKPGMRVRVSQGTGLAYSRSARLDQLILLWQNGILRDPEAFAQLADIPIPQLISAKAHDVLLARNENLVLGTEQAVTANSWDDHTIHLREHNNYRKTAEFAKSSVDTKQRFEHHCQEHEQMEMVQLQKEAKKAAALQAAIGPTPAAGGASPPAPDPSQTAAEVGPTPQA